MTYYGINNSSQYGSNFSSILAASPPPLDDTVDEDDNFDFNGTRETGGSNTAEHNDVLRDDTVDDFGDFEAFADFKDSETVDSTSTDWFSPTDTKQSPFWPANSKDQVITSLSEGQAPEIDDDFANFEGFRSGNSENVLDGSVKAASLQHDYPNKAQNGITPVSNKDATEVDHCNDDSIKHVHHQGESLNGGQSMKQASLSCQQEFSKSSASDTSKDTAAHEESSDTFKESDDSDDEFGEFSTSKMIDRNLDPAFQDVSKHGKDLNDAKTKNQAVASTPGDSLATTKDCQQAEREQLHFDNFKCEGSGTPLENEAILSSDYQDDFGDFSCSDNTRHLSKDQRTDEADFSAFQGEKKPEHISQDNSSNPVTSSEHTDMENNSLESKQAESDVNVSSKANVDSEWKVSAEQNSLAADFAVSESKVDKDSFDAFDSDNCVKDTEHGGFGDFSAFSQENFGSKAEPESNSAMLDNVSTSPQNKANGNDVEETDNTLENAGITANDEFGDFSSVEFTVESSVLQKQDSSDVQEAGTITVPEKGPEVSADDDFGDFNSVDFMAESSVQHKQDTSHMEKARTVNAPKSSEITDEDDFGDFTPNSSVQQKAVNNDFKEVSTTNAASDVDEDFGDFNTFDSQPKGPEHHEPETSNSGESKATVIPEKAGWEDEDFGDFSTFDSKSDLTQQNAASKNSEETLKTVTTAASPDGDFGNFDNFNSKADSKGVTDEFEAFPVKDADASQTKSFADFGAFSGGQSEKDKSVPLRTLQDSSSDDFGAFPPPKPSTSFAGVQKQTFQSKNTSQSTVLDHNTKQHPQATDKVKDIYLLVPCNNITTHELGKSVMMCFSAIEALSRKHGSVNSLNTKLHQEGPSHSKVWEHLKSTVVDGSLRFNWDISISQHKILTSLNARVQSVPTASYMRPEVQSLPPFASGLSLLEPIKGPYVPTMQHSIQDTNPAQNVFYTPPQVDTPDLNFGLRRPPSHKSLPDIKDYSSDTVSESSSLDLDFLGTSLPTVGTERKEFKSHYEDDLLGLSLDSGNLSETSANEVKPETEQPPEKKSASVKTVWQFGDVTIPLASQETKVKLSDKGQALIRELEDLAFMQSPVLMFPIKTT